MAKFSELDLFNVPMWKLEILSACPRFAPLVLFLETDQAQIPQRYKNRLWSFVREMFDAEKSAYPTHHTIQKQDAKVIAVLGLSVCVTILGKCSRRRIATLVSQGIKVLPLCGKIFDDPGIGQILCRIKCWQAARAKNRTAVESTGATKFRKLLPKVAAPPAVPSTDTGNFQKILPKALPKASKAPPKALPKVAIPRLPRPAVPKNQRYTRKPRLLAPKGQEEPKIKTEDNPVKLETVPSIENAPKQDAVYTSLLTVVTLAATAKGNGYFE